MDFLSLNIPTEIYTTDTNPIATFFVPVLKLSKKYDVAVGYFSSNWIKNAAEGIVALVKNQGKSRWVINPELSEQDWLIFETFNDSEKLEWISQKIDDSFSQLFKELKEDTRNVLAWLIYKEIIDFRIAVPTKELSGIFHPKIGIFTDKNGNEIAFTGSYNATAAANTNWEQIEIFCSWIDSKRVQSKVSKFNNIWNELERNLKIYKPSDTTLQKIIKYRDSHHIPTDYIEIEKSIPQMPHIPFHFLKNGKLRNHQENAISAWGKNKGHGIFNMATGSGKTVTALATATRLLSKCYDKNIALGIIVIVPYKHLADQWEVESRNFGFSPIKCYGNYKSWIDNAINGLNKIKLNLIKDLFFITSNATFLREKFQGVLSQFQQFEIPYLLIADEMHNLGGNKINKQLPSGANFRLGLSATPARYMDEVGTDILKNYFGKEVIKYGISDAINDGTLCKYFYYPILVNFTEEEEEKYIEISQSISKVFNRVKNNPNSTDEENLKILLLKRSRLMANADNKIVKLKELLEEKKESRYNLIYCGDEIEYDILEQSLDSEACIEPLRQVDKILKMLGNDLEIKANKFTAQENQVERKEILNQFADGDVQCLVSIRCLDEGVDIPRTESAYILASSSNPKQFIQRRGRVLRKSEGKQYAKIYDFVVVPKIENIDNDPNFNISRSLLKKELKRVNEFAEVSINSGEALKVLRKLRKKLNLMDS